MTPEQIKRAFTREPDNYDLAYQFVLAYLRLNRPCEILQVFGENSRKRYSVRQDIAVTLPLALRQMAPELQYAILEAVIRNSQVHECYLEVKDMLMYIGRYIPPRGAMSVEEWRAQLRRMEEENALSWRKYRIKALKLFDETYGQLPEYAEYEDFDDWEKTPIQRERKALLLLMKVVDAQKYLGGPDGSLIENCEWDDIVRHIYEFDEEIFSDDEDDPRLLYALMRGDLKDVYEKYIEESFPYSRLPAAHVHSYNPNFGRYIRSIEFIDRVNSECLEAVIRLNSYWLAIQFMDSGARYHQVFDPRSQSQLWSDLMDEFYP